VDATSFTVNCVVTENGVGVKDDKGNNKVMSFVLKASDVHVGNSWNAMGMTATGSQPFTVKNLAVSCAHAFEANVGQQVKGPLYYYPFRELAEATLAINMSGMCFNFIDLCENIFQERKRVGADAYTLRPRLHDSVDSYKQKLEQARQKLYYAADMSWQMCAAKNEVSPSVLYKVSAASFALTDVVRECVHALYQYCGLEAADRDSEINRVFRNIITAGQHGMLIGDGSR
jgi:alkylation response protein AidB-like acyl-CoA dehydrogenase